MLNQNELKQLQKRVYWYYHQDGLVDILFGFGVVGFGLMLLTGNAVYDIVAWMISLSLYMLIKKSLTVSRIGYVEFQQKRTIKFGVISLALGILMLFAVIGLIFLIRSGRLPASWQAVLSSYDMLIIGGLLSIPLILFSVLTGLLRPLAYIAMIFLIILSGILLGIQPPIYMIAIGVIIMLSGLIYMLKFLSQHPIRKTDA